MSVFTIVCGLGLMREKRVLDGGTERQALDPLRRPIGGDLAAAHPPHFFGVGLKEDAEQALAKLVGDPIFKGLRVGRGWRRAARNETMQSVDSIKPSFDNASNGFRG